MKTVMLVEDTVLHRKLFETWLELGHYRVHVVADERLAIVTAAKLQPDVIVVDILLPYIDGREIIRGLCRNGGTEHIPIMALSVLSEHQDEDSCYAAGARVFRSKSIRRVDFLECLDALVA
jgi:CheY-like chemotaxis protein